MVSTGIAPLDQLLPEGGFRRGTLVEWLAAAEGSGVENCALRAVVPVLQSGRVFVVIDPSGEFYPPAAAALGIPPADMLVIRPARAADLLWSLEQALRCPGVGATLCEFERLSDRAFRRLQLAAEAGGGLGLLLRPASVRSQPSWAEVRLLVEPLPASRSSGRRVRIELLRCRGGMSGGAVELEVSHETNSVHLVSPLVAPVSPRRAAGA